MDQHSIGDEARPWQGRFCGRIKLSEALEGPIISVVVGSKTFHLHLALLDHNSDYFTDKLNAAGEVELPDVEPEVFRLYAKYLYTGVIECDLISTRMSTCTTLAKLHNLSRQLQFRRLQEALLMKFVTDSDRVTGMPDELLCELLELCYREAGDTDRLCDMVLAIVHFARKDLGRDLDGFAPFQDMVLKHADLMDRMESLCEGYVHFKSWKKKHVNVSNLNYLTSLDAFLPEGPRKEL